MRPSSVSSRVWIVRQDASDTPMRDATHLPFALARLVVRELHREAVAHTLVPISAQLQLTLRLSTQLKLTV